MHFYLSDNKSYHKKLCQNHNLAKGCHDLTQRILLHRQLSWIGATLKIKSYRQEYHFKDLYNPHFCLQECILSSRAHVQPRFCPENISQKKTKSVPCLNLKLIQDMLMNCHSMHIPNLQILGYFQLHPF